METSRRRVKRTSRNLSCVERRGPQSQRQRIVRIELTVWILKVVSVETNDKPG